MTDKFYPEIDENILHSIQACVPLWAFMHNLMNMTALITLHHDDGSIKSSSSGYLNIETEVNLGRNSIVVDVHRDFVHNIEEATKAKVKFFPILDDCLHEVELSGIGLQFNGEQDMKTANLICETADAQQLYLLDKLKKDMHSLKDVFCAIPSTVKEIISNKAFIFTRKVDGSIIFSSGNGLQCSFSVTKENGITIVSAQESNLDSPLGGRRKCLKHKASACSESLGSLIVHFEKLAGGIADSHYSYEYWMQHGIFAGTDYDVSNLKAVSQRGVNEGSRKKAATWLVFGADMSSAEYTRNVWVKESGEFTIIIDINKISHVGSTLRLRFQREGSTNVIDVLSLQISNLWPDVNAPYEDRVVVKRNMAIRKVNVTLLNCGSMDAGLYSCKQMDTIIEECGHKLHVLDLREIVTTLHRDIKMTFDLSRLHEDVTSVAIMHRPDNDDRWQEMVKLVVTLASMRASTAYLFPRKLQLRAVRRTLEVTLDQVMLSDSGFYGCFSGKGLEYIPTCGYRLTVRDYVQVGLHGRGQDRHHVPPPRTTTTGGDTDRPQGPRCTSAQHPVPLGAAAHRQEESGTLEVTIASVLMSDSGYFGCFTGTSETYLPGCGYPLIVEDIPKRQTTLHKNITMTFDLSQVANIEPSVLIMYRPGVDDDRWREVLTVSRETMRASRNSLFHREVHHGPGRARFALDVTLMDVLLPDSGFYCCFTGSTETYIPGCGYRLIVEVQRQKADLYVTVMTFSPGNVSSSEATGYRARTAVTPTGQDGTLSVTLMHVTLADTGDYRCYVGSSIDYKPACGYRLAVYVEESQDSNQVNTIEDLNVNLTFEVAPPQAGRNPRDRQVPAQVM
ncbi:hypothetical protein Btru_000576 [Bulinus truncatus]|nr:hypothetical protein Btru_000576 [Bulinus truncatus]